MKKKVKISAPGKLMLFGEHAVVYGKPCIVTAVDERMKVSVEATDGNLLTLNAPDLIASDYVEKIDKLGDESVPKEVRFVSKAVKNFFDSRGLKSGLKIETKSDFSSKFGFGSSSAVTVATIKALSEIFDCNLDNRELFELSYKTILDVQGVGSGFDVAVAIWGEMIYFVTKGKKIEKIDSPELPLVVGYTGIKADTPMLISEVNKLLNKDKKRVFGIFDSIEKIVNEARQLFTERDYVKLGELMNENQKLLDALNVSSPELDKLIESSKLAGAYGAKLSGAGGGDCMVALVPPDKKVKVEGAIEEAGGTVINVKSRAQGARIEKNI